MFDVHCPNHGSRVLLFSSDIEATANTREGIEVHYRCFCGYRGVWLTGRRSAESKAEGTAAACEDQHESA